MLTKMSNLNWSQFRFATKSPIKNKLTCDVQYPLLTPLYSGQWVVLQTKMSVDMTMFVVLSHPLLGS